MLIDQEQRFIANKFPQTLVAGMINFWIAKKKFLRELDKCFRTVTMRLSN